MKSKITFLFLFFLFCNYISVIAQNFKSPDGSGEYVFNESKTPCLTDEQRVLVLAEIKNGILQLRNQNRLNFSEFNRGSHPLFIWPVQKAAGVTYNDVWGISGYVDHNAAFPNQLTDFNCGTKTYDTAAGYNHAGVDIFTWPFSWKMMDNDEVEIIAAAPGQIIAKGGSQFDRSCVFNNNVWNAVYVQHSDGSVALYGHMKQNSLTTKNVGDMVDTGEFLGIVGSSGNSTGPHLHFEVYSEIEQGGTGQDVLVDPYEGACNSLNVDSWWLDQKPYVNPNINAALTHDAEPNIPNCPTTTDITNESNQFEPNQVIYFGVYLRDQIAGAILNLEIIQPNDTVFEAWSYNLPVSYNASYLYWSNNTFNIPGEWKWRVTYQGQIVTHTFNVGSLSVGEEDFNATSIYPNPFKDRVSITSSSVIQKATVTDVLGKTIMALNTTSDGIKEVNLESISNGMYFLMLEGDSNQKKTIKILKE